MSSFIYKYGCYLRYLVISTLHHWGMQQVTGEATMVNAQYNVNTRIKHVSCHAAIPIKTRGRSLMWLLCNMISHARECHMSIVYRIENIIMQLWGPKSEGFEIVRVIESRKRCPAYSDSARFSRTIDFNAEYTICHRPKEEITNKIWNICIILKKIHVYHWQ